MAEYVLIVCAHTGSICSARNKHKTQWLGGITNADIFKLEIIRESTESVFFTLKGEEKKNAEAFQQRWMATLPATGGEIVPKIPETSVGILSKMPEARGIFPSQS